MYADQTWDWCEYPKISYFETGTISIAMTPKDSRGRWYRCNAGGPQCTNFASQVMLAGGYSMVWGAYPRVWSYTHGTYGSYPHPGYDSWTDSWVNAYWFYQFLVLLDHDNGSTGPGGGNVVRQGYINHNDTSNALLRGDMIFFDQGNVDPYTPGTYTGIDHTKVEVTWELRSDGKLYDLADQRDPKMYHQPWNGSSSVWGYIYQVHIDPANI